MRLTIKRWYLPELTAHEKSEFLEYYNNIISVTGNCNGADSLWWYTWSSTRDRFNSRIRDDLELLFRFQKACAHGLPQFLVVACKDPYLAGAVKSIAGSFGINAHVAFKARLQWGRLQLWMIIRPLLASVLTCVHILKQKRMKQGIHRGSVVDLQTSSGKDLIVTWLKPGNLIAGNSANDTYFGSLPQYIEERGREVVIFGDVLGDPSDLPREGIQKDNPTVFTLADYSDYFGMFVALLKGIFSGIKVPCKDLRPDYNVISLLKKDIHNNKSSIVYGLLFERALRKLCNEYNPTHILHSCENNSWERACAIVGMSLKDPPIVTGFLHNAVVLAHSKIVITEQEKLVRPRPESIVCTGEAARQLMIKFGGHSPDEVVSGCALRHEYLWKLKQRTHRQSPIRDILVILGGIPTIDGLLNFAHETLDGDSSFRVKVRLYPIDSISSVMADAELSLNELRTLEFSDQTTLGEDLEYADIVIYNGSTVAIEAGYLGIPLIHVDSNLILTNDPLFETEALKVVVKNQDELFDAIKYFDDMSDDEYSRLADSLRQYIDGYFVRPTSTSMESFLPISDRFKNYD